MIQEIRTVFGEIISGNVYGCKPAGALILGDRIHFVADVPSNVNATIQWIPYNEFTDSETRAWSVWASASMAMN